ncbi:MAG: hypothetical protein KGM17_07810 [Sphingomonadales bacterium]|nr:hypothetical protein [Sphingomonadales bacterium]
MTWFQERPAAGLPRWAAEVVLRGLGLGSLAGAAVAAIHLHRLVIATPPHAAALAEFAQCGGAVLLLSCGLALSLEGTGLFRRVPRPPRPLLP